MQFAGDIPIDILQLVARAGEVESQWPSRHDPNPSPAPVYRYDEHMKQHVPNMPRRV